MASVGDFQSAVSVFPTSIAEQLGVPDVDALPCLWSAPTTFFRSSEDDELRYQSGRLSRSSDCRINTSLGNGRSGAAAAAADDDDDDDDDGGDDDVSAT